MREMNIDPSLRHVLINKLNQVRLASHEPDPSVSISDYFRRIMSVHLFQMQSEDGLEQIKNSLRDNDSDPVRRFSIRAAFF